MVAVWGTVWAAGAPNGRRPYCRVGSGFHFPSASNLKQDIIVGMRSETNVRTPSGSTRSAYLITVPRGERAASLLGGDILSRKKGTKIRILLP